MHGLIRCTHSDMLMHYCCKHQQNPLFKKMHSGAISKSSHCQLLKEIRGNATSFKAFKRVCLQNGPSENLIHILVRGHVHKEAIGTYGRIVWAELMTVIPSARVGIQCLARTAEGLIAIAPNALYLLHRDGFHLPHTHKCWRDERRERTHIPHNPRGAKLSVVTGDAHARELAVRIIHEAIIDGIGYRALLLVPGAHVIN